MMTTLDDRQELLYTPSGWLGMSGLLPTSYCLELIAKAHQSATNRRLFPKAKTKAKAARAGGKP